MPRDDTDPIAADNLVLFIDNDGELYRQQHTSILKNLMTKRARGEYDPRRAVDAFLYLVESGAKKYARVHGDARTPWHVLFPVATRRAAAELLAKSFETEAELGNYDQLLPAKYQAESVTRKAMAMPAGGYDPGYVGFPSRASASTPARKKTRSQLDSEVRGFLAQEPPRASRRKSRA